MRDVIFSLGNYQVDRMPRIFHLEEILATGVPRQIQITTPGEWRPIIKYRGACKIHFLGAMWQVFVMLWK